MNANLPSLPKSEPAMRLILAAACPLILRCLGGLSGITLFVLVAMTAAAAQEGDLNAILRRFDQAYDAGDYAAALVQAQKWEAIVKARFGVNHSNYGSALNNLAKVYATQGKYGEAEELFKGALAIKEKTKGERHPDVATSLNNLANVYDLQGKHGEAEGLYKRALVIIEKALGRSHPDVALINKHLADAYQLQGRHNEAEGLYKRVLAVREQAMGANHPYVAETLVGLANVYNSRRQYDEAEGLYQRALAIEERSLGPNHPQVAITLYNLASVHAWQRRYYEAEKLFKRALAINENAFGTIHPQVGRTLHGLATVYLFQLKHDQAEGTLKRALTIAEKTLGADHPDVAEQLNNLAVQYRMQGKYGDAEEFFQRALTIRKKGLGESHPDVARNLKNLASLYAASGKADSAVTYSRKASAAVIMHATAESAGAQQKGKLGDFDERRAYYFADHVDNLHLAARAGVEPAQALGREALEIAQWATHSSAATALQQMASRFAATGGALANLVRERQDLSASWRERDNALLQAISKPEGRHDAALINSIRRQIAESERRLAAIAGQLEKQFPEYAALASPKPLKAEDVQGLINVDEAVVFWLSGDKQSTVFALTRDGFEWKIIALGAEALEQKVAAFRRGLDVDALARGLERLECTQAEADKRGLSRIECASIVAKECEEAERRGLGHPGCGAAAEGQRELFDLGVAHELYDRSLVRSRR